jgi:hypothetical protein
MTGAAIALLLLAACGTSGGLGDIFGGGTGTNNGTYATQIRGTVDSVDTSSRSILLTNASGNGSMLSSSGSGSSVRVYYDNRTSVDYQGQSYRPEDLERGDQVDVRVDQSGNQLRATSMSVIYNARTGSGSSTSPGTYGTTIHGIVRSVDTNRRTITIDRGSNGGYITVVYNTNTPVYYGNRTYRPMDLQAGDEVDVRLSGNSAQDITVTRSVSGNGPYSNNQSSTIRGTVRNVDAANRRIQLDSPTWTSGFNRGSATNASTITVSYDQNTIVDVNGQPYPVTNLERGDVVDVLVQNSSSSIPFAQRIILVRDVNQR